MVPGGRSPQLAISFLCWNIYCCYWLGCYQSTRHPTLIEPVNQSEAELITDLLTLLPTTPTLFVFESPSSRNQKHALICIKLCLNIASWIQYLTLASCLTIFFKRFQKHRWKPGKKSFVLMELLQTLSFGVTIKSNTLCHIIISLQSCVHCAVQWRERCPQPIGELLPSPNRSCSWAVGKENKLMELWRE